MTLYLKYRSKNLDELDIPEVGESLKKILKSDNIPHAFLFSGPKGTGKTSAARILAKIINCENLQGMNPCDKCEQCLSITKGNNLDVIEMDAASHRGIDDVRSLRDAVKLSPTLAKKKIYIIDEAHMLTTEASNALLKTLEEPPEHVIFILATTNPEKLIDTIRSRTTLIPFRKAKTEEIIKSLKRIVESEKIKVTDETLVKIAEAANGAFRDGIKILEQYSLEGEVYLESFVKSDLSEFIDFLVSKNSLKAIEIVEKNASQGVSMEGFLSSLLEAVHVNLLAEVGVVDKKNSSMSITDLILVNEIFGEAYTQLANSPIDVLPVEVAIIKFCQGELKTDDKDEPKKVEPAPVEDIVKSDDRNVKSDNEDRKVNYDIRTHAMNTQTSDVVVQSSSQTSDLSLPTSVQMVNDDIWKNILMAVRPVNASIEGLLRSSKPVAYDGKTLTLGVFYKFHKERLEDAHHKKVLEDVLTTVLNGPTRIACTLVDPPSKVVMQEATREPILTETKDTDIMKIAEDIFSN